MASKPKVGSLENPRVLAVVSGVPSRFTEVNLVGSGVDSLQLAQLGKQKFNLGASLQQNEQLQVLAMLEINS